MAFMLYAIPKYCLEKKVVNKVSKNIGIIANVRHLLPQTLTRNLYFTLVHSHINYCNLIWASPHKSTQLDRIMRIQKKYCRLITFSKYDAHSRPLFVRLSILNVYEVHTAVTVIIARILYF